MKLNMLKKLFMIFCAIAVGVSLFACGGEKSETKIVKHENTEEIDEEAEFDGNTMEIVEISNGVFSKTLSQPFKKDTYSKKEQKNIDAVKAVLDSADLNADNKIFECLYGDFETGISVWSLLKGRQDESFNNYGIIIRYNGKNYPFAEVCHGNDPNVDVNEETGRIMFAGGVMEGTGTHTEAIYVFDAKNDKVELVGFVDPYDVQNYFVEYLKFDVDNNNIEFKHNNKKIVDFTNIEEGQGTLRAIAIGDQIEFDFDDDHNAIVSVTPGLQLVTVITAEQVQKDVVHGDVVIVASNSEYVAVVRENKNKKKSDEEDEKITSNNPQAANIGTQAVLVYDNVPTFIADVTINKDKAEFKNIRLEGTP